MVNSMNMGGVMPLECSGLKDMYITKNYQSKRYEYGERLSFMYHIQERERRGGKADKYVIIKKQSGTSRIIV